MMARRLMRRSFGPVSSTKTTRVSKYPLLSGQAFVNRVRDDVGDAAPHVRRGEILLAGELLARKHVPQTKFGLEPPVGLAREPAGEKGLGVDGAPVLEARDRVGIDDALDVGGGVDRREQAGAFEVVGDDLRDPTRGFAIARSAADEIRQRDRHWLHVAGGDFYSHRGGRGARPAEAEGADTRAKRKQP